MFTFHSIDTVTGQLSDKAELNADEVDQHMLSVESKHWACQLVCGLTNKKVVFIIGEAGQWVVHSKQAGF